MITALIPAAGSGSRLGRPEPKALIPIGGRPLLAWSLSALAAVEEIDEILVAVPPASIGIFEALRADLGIDRWRAVVPGGVTRTGSVRVLLERARSDRVLVHDAARPCITSEWVRALVAELGDGPAGVPAIPVRDTLKRGDRGLVSETVSRDGLFQVQTPQLFDAALLRRAHETAREAATDDAVLVESLGTPVRLLTGSPWNVKVTFPYDLPQAELFLMALFGKERS